MYYKKSKEIEDRFTLAISLIFFFRPNIETLTAQLNVSRPTVIRIISELRRRGNDIVIVRDPSGWHYEVRNIAAFLESLSFMKSISSNPSDLIS
jgi:hypothetical protein